MARVTVEDCVQQIPNRFQLVLMAAHRSRMIREGSPMTVEVRPQEEAEREEDERALIAPPVASEEDVLRAYQVELEAGRDDRY